jgi:CheY-like chemotaxis protein
MKRVLLRAELTQDGEEPVIAHTLELSESAAFVETDARFPVDSLVRIRLSFPRLVGVIHLSGRVTEHSECNAPGEPSGMELSIEPESAEDGERLRTVLATLPRAPDEQARERFHVLLVEDNSLIRDMFSFGIRRYFRDKPNHVTVDHAADGETAWQMLTAGSYDLAIVDHYLPLLSGAKLVERVRAEPRLADLPIVAVSVGGSEVREATLAAGADLFLDKPLVLSDLFATLERLHAQGGAR